MPRRRVVIWFSRGERLAAAVLLAVIVMCTVICLWNRARVRRGPPFVSVPAAEAELEAGS